MSITNVIVGIINLVLSVLTIPLWIAFPAAALMARRKSAQQSRETLLFLSIAALAVLCIRSLISFLSTFFVLWTHGELTYYIGNLLIGLLFALVSAAAAMAFPIAACVGKTGEKPLVGLLLLLPALQTLYGLICAIGGLNVYEIGGSPSVFGILCNLMVLAALAFALVWFLTGQKPGLSRGMAVGIPAAFCLALLFAMLAASGLYGIYDLSSLLSVVSLSENIFSVPLRLLLAALWGLAVRAICLEHPAAPGYGVPQPNMSQANIPQTHVVSQPNASQDCTQQPPRF